MIINLPTKTIGVSAKSAIRKHLPTVKTMKRVSNSFVLRDEQGVMLGHVEQGGLHSPKARLVLAKR